MEHLTISDYKIICRFCLKKRTNIIRLIPLNDDLIKNALEAIHININLDDPIFPNRICLKCKKSLKQSIDYRNRSLKADTSLRLHFSSHASEIEKNLTEADNAEIFANNIEISVPNETIVEGKIKKKSGRPRKQLNTIDESIQELDQNSVVRKSIRVRKTNPKFVDTYVCDNNESNEDEKTFFENKITSKNTIQFIEIEQVSPPSSPISFSDYQDKTDQTLIRKCDFAQPLSKLKYRLKSQCELCDVIVPTKLMRYHINEHNKYFPYKCDMCEKTFSSPIKRSNHNRFVHSTKVLSCNLCDVTFKSLNNLHRHKKGVHLKMFLCKCQTCNAEFTTKEAYNRHLMIHSNFKPFVCQICNKGFRTPFNLKIHQHTHFNYKPYRCEICDAEFGYNLALKKHVQKTHLEELKMKFD